MKGLKIFTVSDNYIEYLSERCENIYSNKVDTRIHKRKYVGVVLTIKDYLYYIPMSSPKKTDYQKAGHSYAIKKSIVPIIRMTARNKLGEKELKGTLRISHMIPVPKSEIKLYDLDNERDVNYKNLVLDELRYINDNTNKIYQYANVMYKQKCENSDIGYVKTALPFIELERLCNEYENSE